MDHQIDLIAPHAVVHGKYGVSSWYSQVFDFAHQDMEFLTRNSGKSVILE